MSQRNNVLRDSIKVLVVGQTPPPFHGQGIMLDRLVHADMEGVELYHVRMAFSKSMDEVGRFEIGKLLHLFVVIASIFWHRIRYGIPNLYYPPAGPNRIPMFRDFVILIATRWLFQKTIFHMQASGISTLYPKLRGIGRLLFRLAYFRADAVIRLAEGTEQDAVNLSAKHEVFIPNCAEDVRSQYEATITATRGQTDPKSPINLLYLGTVCHTKGILDLLDACRQLAEQQVDFKLRIVGTFQPASFEHTVREKIQAAGLSGSIDVCGQLIGDRKFQEFAKAEVFCFPTFYESEAFPCVLVEAMSFGLPVISTDWRGIPAIVEHEHTGILVSPNDPTGIAEAVRRLHDDYDYRSRLGAAGRARFKQYFTTERHIELMQSMFTNVCKSSTDSKKNEKVAAAR